MEYEIHDKRYWDVDFVVTRKVQLISDSFPTVTQRPGRLCTSMHRCGKVLCIEISLLGWIRTYVLTRKAD
jgi:hypothetical protein